MKIARNFLVLLVFCGLFLCARSAFAALGTLSALHHPQPQEQGFRLRQRVLEQEAERLLAQIRLLAPDYRGNGNLQRLSEDYQRIRRTMILEIVGFTGFGYPSEAPDRQLVRDYNVMVSVKREEERRFLARAAATTPNGQAPVSGTQEARTAGNASESLAVAGAEQARTESSLTGLVQIELVTGYGEDLDEISPLLLSHALPHAASGPASVPAVTEHNAQARQLPELTNIFKEVFTRFGVPSRTPCRHVLSGADRTSSGEDSAPRRMPGKMQLALRLPH